MDEPTCLHYFCSECAEKGKDNTHRNKLLVSRFTWTVLTDDTNQVNQFHCGERLEDEHLQVAIGCGRPATVVATNHHWIGPLQYARSSRWRDSDAHAVIAILEKEKPEVIEWIRTGTASNQRKSSPGCEAQDITTAFWQNTDRKSQTEANTAGDSDNVNPTYKECVESIQATINSLHPELTREINDVFEVFDLFSLVQEVLQESAT